MRAVVLLFPHSLSSYPRACVNPYTKKMAKRSKHSTTSEPTLPCKEMINQGLQKSFAMLKVHSLFFPQDPNSPAWKQFGFMTEKVLDCQGDKTSQHSPEFTGQVNASTSQPSTSNVAVTQNHDGVRYPNAPGQQGHQNPTPMERWLRESVKEAPWSDIKNIQN